MLIGGLGSGWCLCVFPMPVLGEPVPVYSSSHHLSDIFKLAYTVPITVGLSLPLGGAD